MGEQTAVHSTCVIERNYPASPERVFAAFADPVKKRRWFAEGVHHELETYELDFRTGGKEYYFSRFKEGIPVAGLSLSNESTFQNIVPNQRVVFTSTMELEGKVMSVSVGTVEFLPADQGTDLILTFQSTFLENSDGPKMREEGWRKLLERLAKEFEK